MANSPIKNQQRVRVIYADTDAMGIVYHMNYLRWFEIGRTELLRELGLVYAKMESFKFNLPVSKAFCHYLVPACLDDILIVETEIDYFKKASLCFTYTIWNEQMTKKHAEGYTLHACATRDGRIVRLPEVFTKTVEAYLMRRKNYA